MGGWLATPQNEAERQEVEILLQEAWNRGSYDCGSAGDWCRSKAWLGLNDRGTEDHFVTRWDGVDHVNSFYAWADNEPAGGNGQDCVAQGIQWGDGKWKVRESTQW